MKMLQLLNDYPLAAGVVKGWFLNNMLEGLKDDSLPEGFKDYVRQQGIDDARVSDILEANPRSAIDVFDHNEIYIDTTHIDGSFWFAVNSSVYQEKFDTRREAEAAAIIVAFKMLNEKIMRDQVVDNVIDKYYERSQVGITKYGTTLYNNNKDKLSIAPSAGTYGCHFVFAKTYGSKGRINCYS